MRLAIPTTAAHVYLSLQTRIVEMRYACRDERGCLRPTVGTTLAEAYCPQCEHKGQPTCLRLHKPNRLAERAVEAQMAGFRNIVVAAPDDAERQQRSYEHHRSHGKCCLVCGAPISNGATYCRSHARSVDHEKRRHRVHWRLEREQVAP